MTETERKKLVLDYISKERVGVVSTISGNGSPEAAALIISQKSNLELIFQTPNTSRKYTNLKRNPRVAIVFGFDTDEFVTVQHEGIAREASPDEFDQLAAVHQAKSPQFAKYGRLPENKFFVVKPTWVRYWDFNSGQQFVLTF